MDDQKYEYGSRDKRVQVELVRLWWTSAPLKEDSDMKNLCHDQPGVYAFEARHDSRPDGGLLYIGESGGDEGSGTIRERAPKSAKKFLWKEQRERGFYADVWDITLRWALVSDGPLIRAIESLLIHAHAPSFNKQEVRGEVGPDAQRLLVINGGSKGRLLPSVAGPFYDKLWTS